MDIGSLTGVVSIEDQVSDHLTMISSHVKQFAEGFDGALGGLAIGIGAIVTAVVGIGVSIERMGEKGSVINDVQANFDKLAIAAGSTGDILRDKLSEGVKGTIGEFDLMKTTSRLLTSGIKLTGDQALLMGEAARAMGKATGTDATQGLSTLSSALLTGRTRSLAMAGIVVDLKGHEEALAKSLGVTATELSREGKLQADRTAILDATKGYVDRLGISQLNFKEKITQGTVAIEEWTTKLEKSIASSPHVMAALDSIQSALVRAFGGDSQKALDTIVGWVNSFADAVARYAPPIIDAIAEIWHGIIDIWHEVKTAWDWIPEWFKEIAKYSAVAAGGLYLVKGATDVAAGGLLSTIASFATITSGTSDMVKAVGNVPKLYETVKLTCIGMSIAQGEFVLALQYTKVALLEVAVAADALIFNPITISLLAIGSALYVGVSLWDLWGASKKRALETNSTMLQEQGTLNQINAQYGKNFKTFGEAAKFANDQLQERVRMAPVVFGPFKNAADDEANKRTASLTNAARSAAEYNKLLAATQGAKVGTSNWQANMIDIGRNTGRSTLDAMAGLFGGQRFNEPPRLGVGGKFDISEALDQWHGGPAGGLGIPDVKSAARMHIKAAQSSVMDDLFTSVPGAIQAAIQGGGSKLQAAGGAIGSAIFGPESKLTGTITKGIDALFGAGGVMANMIGGMVPIIGPLIGPLIGKITSLFTGSEETNKVSPLRNEFFKMAGGLDALNPKVLALTGNLNLVDAVFKAKTVDEYNAALKGLDDLQQQVNRDIQTASGLYGDIAGKMSNITSISPGLATAIQTAMNAKTPADFVAALTGVGGVLDDQAAKQTKLQELADKYGFSLSEMGPQFAQGKLDSLSKAVIDDWTLLGSLGDISNDKLKKMSKSFQELVTDALQTGSALPASLKDPLQRLADMGALTDDAGKKMTDLGKLNFTDTLDQALKDVKTALTDLRDVLLDLPSKFGLVASSAQTELAKIPRTINVKVIADAPEFGGQGVVGEAGGGMIYAASGSNLLPFTPRGTDTVPAMLTPGERVLTVAQNEMYSKPQDNEDILAELRATRAMLATLPGTILRGQRYAALIGAA